MKRPYFAIENKPIKSLRDFFDRSGYTRREAAERWGVTTSTICRWCSGSRRPTAAHMLKIEEDTGLSIRTLFKASAPKAA